nr:unnamed protein product [Callosobruchus analis]
MVITKEIRDEIKNTVSSCITSILADDEFLTRIVQKVSDTVEKPIEIRTAGIEQKLQEMNLKNNTIFKDLKDETANLRTKNEHLMRKVDEPFQGARQKNIRIFKLKETDNEILIDRNWEKGENKTRGILLELANISLKNNIYDKKKLLKGSSVVLKEDLTGNRLKLMELAIEEHSISHVWSYRAMYMFIKTTRDI